MYTLESGPDGWRRAGELADAVLAADPGNQDARCIRSLELSRSGCFEKALPIAEQLLADGYPKMNLALARARMGLGDHAGALDAARRVLADDPDRVLYLRMESRCLRALQRNDEALRSAQRAARLVPAGHGVQLELGLSAKGAGDAVLAEQALRAAVADAPDEAGPTGELALLLAESDRWAEAEALITALPADVPDPRMVAARCTAIASLAIGRAKPWLAKIDTGNPDTGVLAESARWLAMAIRMWTAAVTRNPDGAEVIMGQGLPTAVDALHQVAAPPDSGFARVVRDFDALLASWRPA
jgi:tetratricopeptide (TPR) repeat protein